MDLQLAASVLASMLEQLLAYEYFNDHDTALSVANAMSIVTNEAWSVTPHKQNHDSYWVMKGVRR